MVSRSLRRLYSTTASHLQSVDNLAPAKAFIEFVNDSPTPFHAVAQSVSRESTSQLCTAARALHAQLGAIVSTMHRCSAKGWTPLISSPTGLEAVGFKRLTERDSWAGKLVAGGKYYITRNQSSIIAFTVPIKVEKEGLGFSIVG